MVVVVVHYALGNGWPLEFPLGLGCSGDHYYYERNFETLNKFPIHSIIQLKNERHEQIRLEILYKEV